MKKNLLIVAIAALAIVSCSSDDTIEVMQDNDVISFRPLVNGVTRAANAAGVKSAWDTGDKLYVYGGYNSSKLLQAEFIKDDNGFSSANKYYWPNDVSSSKPVTFTAFWGAAQKDYTSSGDENQLAAKYTVSNTVADQMDLMIAKKIVTEKPAGGVELNFRHMLSQIVVKVRNPEANLKITVGGVRIGYASNAGTFTYSGNTTDTKTASEANSGGATLVSRTDWTADAATSGATSRFDQTATLTLTGVTPAQSLSGFASYILMPQQLTAATGYLTTQTDGEVTTATAPDLNGAYIALKMQIESLDNGSVTGTIFPEQWCYWPIGTEWKPGYKYTYTIDASQGGYQPTDQDGDGELDPIMDDTGSYIWFSPDCTIDVWVADYTLVPAVPAEDRSVSYAFANASTETINLPAGANGNYTILLTDMTTGNTVTATGTNNFTASPTVTDNGDGTFTISGTLSANVSTSATSVITITDETASESMTINIIQAAP